MSNQHQNIPMPLGLGTDTSFTNPTRSGLPAKKRRLQYKQPPPPSPIDGTLLLVTAVAAAAAFQSTRDGGQKQNEPECKRRRVSEM